MARRQRCLLLTREKTGFYWAATPSDFRYTAAEENLDLTIIAKQYADVIVKKPNRLIDEAMLYHLSKEIRDKRFDEDDIRHLVKILAYTM